MNANGKVLGGAERVADLEAAIQGQVQLQRYYRSLMTTSRERTLAEISRMRGLAAKFAADADRLEDDMTHAKQRYIAAAERAVELRSEHGVAKNAKKLARVEEIQEELADLLAELEAGASK